MGLPTQQCIALEAPHHAHARAPSCAHRVSVLSTSCTCSTGSGPYVEP